MNKTIQDLKLDIEPLKKTQTEGIEEINFRNSDRNYRGNFDQENTRDGRKDFKD